MGFTVSTLLIITAVAVLAPVLVELPPRLRLPVVVAEVALGIAIGPHALDLATLDGLVRFLGTFGLAFLFFLAGLELDLAALRGRPLQLAAAGWGMSLALALIIGAALEAVGFIVSAEFVAAALCTTAVGTLLPILRDAGELDSPLGPFIVAAGACGEFFPILLISVLLTGGSDKAVTGALLVAFSLVAVASAAVAARVRPPWFVRLLAATMHATAQLPVRLSLLILIALVYLAEELGLDVILGAFAAGMVVGLAARSAEAQPLRPKLEAIGFGFLVPIFFITSGMSFDLEGLVDHPTAVLGLPVFLALFLIVRGLPVLLYRRDVGPHDRLPLALYSATALPLVVAITAIAVAGGHMRSDNAAALVGAAMLSVFLFPATAVALRRRHAGVPVAAGGDDEALEQAATVHADERGTPRR